MKSFGPSETPGPTDQNKRRHDSVEYKLKIYLYDNLKFKHYKSGMYKFYRYLWSYLKNMGVVKCDSKFHTGAPRIFVAIGHKIYSPGRYGAGNLCASAIHYTCVSNVCT